MNFKDHVITFITARKIVNNKIHHQLNVSQYLPGTPKPLEREFAFDVDRLIPINIIN